MTPGQSASSGSEEEPPPLQNIKNNTNNPNGRPRIGKSEEQGNGAKEHGKEVMATAKPKSPRKKKRKKRSAVAVSGGKSRHPF
jgi:hypothetical protein